MPGMGWHRNGMYLSSRAVVSANLAIVRSRSGQRRCLRWFGLAMYKASTCTSSRWTTVGGVEPATLEPSDSLRGVEPLVDHLLPVDAQHIFLHGRAFRIKRTQSNCVLPTGGRLNIQHAPWGDDPWQAGRRNEIDGFRSVRTGHLSGHLS